LSAGRLSPSGRDSGSVCRHSDTRLPLTGKSAHNGRGYPAKCHWQRMQGGGGGLAVSHREPGRACDACRAAPPTYQSTATAKLTPPPASHRPPAANPAAPPPPTAARSPPPPAAPPAPETPDAAAQPSRSRPNSVVWAVTAYDRFGSKPVVPGPAYPQLNCGGSEKPRVTTTAGVASPSREVPSGACRTGLRDGAPMRYYPVPRGGR
jgi:hypothetical protein